MPGFKEHTENLIADSGLLPAMMRLLFYPVTQIIVTPIRLVQLLLNSLVLLRGQWGDYSGFVPQTAFNVIFYWTRALNIFKYGRKGRSPYIGWGDYPLARNLILLVVAAGSEALLRYILDGQKENYSVTLRDLVISRYDY